MKSVMTLGDEAMQVNSVLTEFESKCTDMWQETDDSEQSNWDVGNELERLNAVCIKAASSTIPNARRQTAGRVTPSAESIEFASK